jgi:K+-sensing histidine kinase KdpD
MNPNGYRSNPDGLPARLKEEERQSLRGKLKIFLDDAACVGMKR